MSSFDFGIQSKLEDKTTNRIVEVRIFDRSYNKPVSYRSYTSVGPGYSFERFNQFIYNILDNQTSAIHICSSSDDDIELIEYNDHRVSFITKNSKYCSRMDVVFTDRNKEKIVTELMELNRNLKKISTNVPQIESSTMI